MASLVFNTVYAKVFLLFIIGATAQSNVLGENNNNSSPGNQVYDDLHVYYNWDSPLTVDHADRFEYD